jgi:hypothetical protein
MQSLTRKKSEAVLDELAVLGVYSALPDFGSVISLVIEERMSYPVEMDPDLMSSSCFETTFY